jgi:hypothetical protein
VGSSVAVWDGSTEYRGFNGCSCFFWLREVEGFVVVGVGLECCELEFMVVVWRGRVFWIESVTVLGWCFCCGVGFMGLVFVCRVLFLRFLAR